MSPMKNEMNVMYTTSRLALCNLCNHAADQAQILNVLKAKKKNLSDISKLLTLTIFKLPFYLFHR